MLYTVNRPPKMRLGAWKTVFEIKVLFGAPLWGTHINTVRPGILLCTRSSSILQ